MYGLNDEIAGLREELEKVTKERDALKVKVKDLDDLNKKIGEVTSKAMLKKLDGAMTLFHANQDITEAHRQELMKENTRLRDEIQILRRCADRETLAMADLLIDNHRKSQEK